MPVKGLIEKKAPPRVANNRKIIEKILKFFQQNHLEYNVLSSFEKKLLFS